MVVLIKAGGLWHKEWEQIGLIDESGVSILKLGSKESYTHLGACRICRSLSSNIRWPSGRPLRSFRTKIPVIKRARITSAPTAIPTIAPTDKGRWSLAWFPVALFITVDVEVTNVDCPAFSICCVKVTVCPRLVAERLFAERLFAERLVAERLVTERLVAERLAADRLVAERFVTGIVWVLTLEPTR